MSKKTRTEVPEKR